MSPPDIKKLIAIMTYFILDEVNQELTQYSRPVPSQDHETTVDVVEQFEILPLVEIITYEHSDN